MDQFSGSRPVSVDERLVAEKAVKHLVELGHSRIAYAGVGSIVYLANPAAEYIKWRPFSFEQGYINAMSEAALPAIPGWRDRKGTLDQMERFWREEKPPTAVITYDDVEGHRAMNWLKQLGLAVPKDVSIVSLHDVLGTFYAANELNAIHSFPFLTGAKRMQRRWPKRL